tara:strand:+ start:1009 stop:1239 length:231 start_codon:yes stop_codon:yes gene_type:complete
MENIKEIISWYATRKAELIVETEPQEAIDIISEQLAESLNGGNYSDEEICDMIKEDDLIGLRTFLFARENSKRNNK